jgi:hypothetical protein
MTASGVTPHNVFVLGLDAENLEVLQGLPNAHEYAFHQLLTIEELKHGEDIPVQELIAKAERQLDSFGGSIDAIVGYWDFPVSSMVPILCARYGLRCSSLRSRLVCEHKYWARLAQRAITDAHPRFAPVDPFDDDALANVDLDYPFWLKPIKGFSSMFARKITSAQDFHDALVSLRACVGRVGEPFDYVLSLVDLPPEIEALGGSCCIAEEEVTGHQVTVEGYARGDDITVYGIVDTVPYPDAPCFLRYEYPSRLPQSVQYQMADIARAVIAEIGLDHSTFNIELFWDETTDRLSILEINPRHSQSHAWLFWQVDGLPNHELMLDLALDRPRKLPRGHGPYACAAKWFLRRFDDGVVTRVPTADEIAAVEADIPGTEIVLEVDVGERLADLHDQDAYSYKLAHVLVAAADPEELDKKYQQCVERLPFAFEDAG